MNMEVCVQSLLGHWQRKELEDSPMKFIDVQPATLDLYWNKLTMTIFVCSTIIILPSCCKELKAKISIDTFLPARNHQLFILHQRQENRYLEKKKKKKKKLSQLIHKKHHNVS